MVPCGRESEPQLDRPQRRALAQQGEERQRVGQAVPPGGQPPQRAIPVPPKRAENLRRHLEDMERLMDRMRTEMEGIEE